MSSSGCRCGICGLRLILLPSLGFDFCSGKHHAFYCTYAIPTMVLLSFMYKLEKWAYWMEAYLGVEDNIIEEFHLDKIHYCCGLSHSLILLQICQKQKDRKPLAPCTIFNKSKSLLWATWFICLNFLSCQFTEVICFCWIWYKEPGVFCLSVSDRSAGAAVNTCHFFMIW